MPLGMCLPVVASFLWRQPSWASFAMLMWRSSMEWLPCQSRYAEIAGLVITTSCDIYIVDSI